MNKWVIKKGESGKLEVWQYIDTIKEAGKYWYVNEAIKKYGVDDVLPIAMNSRGGYHSLKWDIENGNIVNIVESEEPPTLSLEEKWITNSPDFDCGWVSPDCKTYWCSYMEHLDLASHICEVVYKISPRFTPDDYLLDRGWIKVYSNDGWTGDWTKINDNQIKMLDNMGIKHFTSPEKDYNELIQFKNDFIDWKNRGN